MAIKVKTAAAGNAPATGMGKTPPAKIVPTFPVLREKDSGGAYGQNHYTGPSSAPVSGVPQSPAGQNLTASVDDDGVLDRLIHADKPTKGDIANLDLQSPQTREVSQEQLIPLAHGMKRQQQDYSTIGKPSFPATLTDDESDPVRQPD